MQLTLLLLHCYCYVISLLQKRELVKGFGIYIKYVDLEQAEQTSKNTATGLMRALMSVWYSRERLAGCSANSGINTTIKTCIFSKSICMHVVYLFYIQYNFILEYCEERYGAPLIDKLKRDLMSKCGEERRRMRAGGSASANH